MNKKCNFMLQKNIALLILKNWNFFSFEPSHKLSHFRSFSGSFPPALFTYRYQFWIDEQWKFWHVMWLRLWRIGSNVDSHTHSHRFFLYKNFLGIAIIYPQNVQEQKYTWLNLVEESMIRCNFQLGTKGN